MLGSTHGTFTTGPRGRASALRGRDAAAGGSGERDVGGRPLSVPAPDPQGLARPGVGVFGTPRRDLDGPGVAIVSRCAELTAAAGSVQELGVRVADRVTVGPDGTVGDFVAYFAERADVGVVALHLEGVREGRGLLLALDHAARRGVPVVALTAAGDGADPVMEAALRQVGAVLVDAPDRLLDTATLFARAPRQTGGPAGGDRVAVLPTRAGRHLAGLAAAAGLHPVLQDLDAALADPAVAVAVCPVPSADPPATDILARDLVAAAERADRPVCVVWGSPPGTEPAYRDTLLGSSRAVTFRTYGNCVAAVGAYLAHRRFTAPYRSPFDEAPRTPSPSLRKARLLLESAAPHDRRLSEHAAKQILRTYGVRVPREQLVTSAAAAVRAAGQVGYPVVLKASAPRLAQRAERGLLRVGVTSAGQVREAYREIAAAARREGVALDGVLVAQLVARGVELTASVRHDERFGPVVSVAPGGRLAALGGAVVRVPPFGEAAARALVDALPCRALLGDVDALVEVLLRIQRLALELGDDLVELRVDPLVVGERGRGAVALDAVAVFATPPGPGRAPAP
ncbi:hypothetical protein BJP40_14540 [Streptomyces sp. CC53]|uniref:acetate--CoA ligase family protein n=1 Tax=unclassified Streptomyces TaxID=2593676 RepID=UPI0008DE1611|nr:MULTISPECIES: acetate--CoA ligase family protein [unclassified Streptomyces]OII66061.1 hypothetical protein BJP40_14540 [Streptomyces sp. CC53]